MSTERLVNRAYRHDREIAAIRKIILTGMKLIVENQRGLKELQVAQRELQAGHRQLQAAQKRTEQTLERFIRSLGRGGGNGHSKRAGGTSRLQ